MNPLDLLFGQVANTIRQHSSKDTPGPSYDSNPLLGALSNMFGQHANQNGQEFNGYDQNADYSQHGGFNPQDMLGGLFGGGQDNQGMGNVRPASEDPYGDPADNNYGGYSQQGLPPNVRPASEDPYGDPADR